MTIPQKMPTTPVQVMEMAQRMQELQQQRERLKSHGYQKTDRGFSR